MYHEMAKIMTSTSLSPEDETIFDSEIESFIALMEQATEELRVASLRLAGREEVYRIGISY